MEIRTWGYGYYSGGPAEKAFGETEFGKTVTPCFAESRFAKLGLWLWIRIMVIG
jgi:hypothetical protein